MANGSGFIFPYVPAVAAFSTPVILPYVSGSVTPLPEDTRAVRPDPDRVRELLGLCPMPCGPGIEEAEVLGLAERLIVRELWPFADDSPQDVLRRVGMALTSPTAKVLSGRLLRALFSVAALPASDALRAHELASEAQRGIFGRAAASSSVRWNRSETNPRRTPEVFPGRPVLRYVDELVQTSGTDGETTTRRFFYGVEPDLEAGTGSMCVVGLRRDGRWARRGFSEAVAAREALARLDGETFFEGPPTPLPEPGGNFSVIRGEEPSVRALWQMGVPVVFFWRTSVELAAPLDNSLRVLLGGP